MIQKNSQKNPRIMKNVPEDKVDEIVRMLKKDGAINIKKRRQPNGKWTIEATMP